MTAGTAEVESIEIETNTYKHTIDTTVLTLRATHRTESSMYLPQSPMNLNGGILVKQNNVESE